MTFPTRLLLTIVGAVTASLLGAFAIRRGAAPEMWVPLGLSIGSLVVSVLAAFKSELFGFSPTVIASDLGIVHVQHSVKGEEPQPVRIEQLTPTGPAIVRGTVPMFVVPMWFINSGYAEGIIEAVSLKLTAPSEGAFTLNPVLELKPTKLFQNRKSDIRDVPFHVDRIEGTFVAFPLASKQSLSKTLLFSYDLNRVTKILFAPGTFRFEVLVYIRGSRKPKLLHTFEHDIDQASINEFFEGRELYFSTNMATARASGASNEPGAA